MGWFDWFRKRPTSGAPDPREWQKEAQWAARARFITHVSDFLGDPSDELAPNPGMELPDRPEFLVLEFAPRDGRNHYTYLTAGLGLWPQAAEGPTPHLEIIAYSDRREPRIAQLLFMLSHDIASVTSSGPAYKPFDLWGAECWGLRDFVLVPANDDAELLDFPNSKKRQEDERYLLAATGDLQGEMTLTVVQLLPLTTAEWERATLEGSVALLEAMRWEELPRAYGWSALQPEVTGT